MALNVSFVDNIINSNTENLSSNGSICLDFSFEAQKQSPDLTNLSSLHKDNESCDNKCRSLFNDDTGRISKYKGYISEDNLDLFFHDSRLPALNIMQVNCRSITKNIGSLERLLGKLSKTINAVALCETWLSPVTEEGIFVSGYKTVFNSRFDREGGGVGFLVSADTKFIVKSDLSYTHDFIECIFIEILQL